MFRAYCAVCHATDGRGGGPAADSLEKRPADLPIWGNVFRSLGDETTVKLRTDNLTNYVESLQRLKG